MSKRQRHPVTLRGYIDAKRKTKGDGCSSEAPRPDQMEVRDSGRAEAKLKAREYLARLKPS